MLSQPIRTAISLLFLISLPAASQQPQTATSLPDAIVQQEYLHQLTRPDGKAPWAWRIISGALPPGLAFSPEGTLTGIPQATGTYDVQVEAEDSASPPQTLSYDLTLTVQPRLEIRWEAKPAIQSDRIEGSLVVVNHTEDPLDLTVIIVAVNEIGKAFALGYQHFNLAPGPQQIPFGASLPRGAYVVHGDAIGERAVPPSILHSRLQTPEPLVVP